MYYPLVTRLLMVLLGILGAPFLLGIINRVKAICAGRQGVPLLQVYYDILKLARKSTVYSRTTGWIFRFHPPLNLTGMVLLIALLPMGKQPACLSFMGDFILFAYILAAVRFVMMLAALDTGSSFEGMGASREAQFSALAEPALLVSLAALVCVTKDLSLSQIFLKLSLSASLHMPALVLTAIALMIVFLAENSRIPVDDPNTHLELTMIHEVLILDYSGPDLGMLHYAAALKIWILGALVVNLVLSFTNFNGFAAIVAFIAGMILLATIVGIIESLMARLTLLKVPRLLGSALVLAVLAFAFILRAT